VPVGITILVGVLEAVIVGVGVSEGTAVAVSVAVDDGVGVWVEVIVTVAVGAATTLTSVVDARQLFVSLLSVTLSRSSAHATRKYTPRAVDVGTVTSTDPFRETPGDKFSTVRLPVRRIAELSLAPSTER
jgi:hypothetical protein